MDNIGEHVLNVTIIGQLPLFFAFIRTIDRQKTHHLDAYINIKGSLLPNHQLTPNSLSLTQHLFPL